MNKEMYRFLAMNCVLNKRSLFDAFDGDIDKAADAFDVEASVLENLDKNLARLEENKVTDRLFNIESTALNFMRNYMYAFIHAPTGANIFLSSLVIAERNGEAVDRAVRNFIISTMIKDISFSNDGSSCYIADGCLHVPVGTTRVAVDKALANAYRLFLNGPGTGKETLLSLRDSLSICTFKSLPARKCIKALTELVKAKIAPSDFTDTTLLISDLLPVYQASGCLMCPSEFQSHAIDWLLVNYNSPDGTKSVTLEEKDVGALIITDAHDLSNVLYDIHEKNTGYLRIQSGD